MRRSWLRQCAGVALAAGLLLAVRAVLADTMLVPRVELREEERGLYVLDADMARALVGRARPPIVPAGCVPDTEPDISDKGRTLLVRYVLDCRQRPLGPGDEIFLPWNLDGIQLNVRWADGEERRGLFGRESTGGVLIRFDLIMPRHRDPVELTLEYLGFGLRHFLTGWNHLLLILGLAVLLPVAGLVPVLAGFTGGHALSLVLAELGAVGLPALPAEATIAAAVVVFAALAGGGKPAARPDGAWLEPGTGLILAAVLLGLIHGLGLATHLADGGLNGGSLLVALFAANVGIDAVGWILGLGGSAAAIRIREREYGRRTAVTQAVGTAGAFFMFFTLAAALSPPGRLAQAANSYLEMGSVGGPARGSAGVPTQLTSAGQLARPFISYLIVEPYQVRLEVLVAAQALEEWLELPADASGVIPAQEGEAFSRQVADLLASENRIVIDGAPTRPAAQRADFVTVGTTGVLTREEPAPEPVATAILGVTLLYETEGIPEAVEVEWGLFSEAAVPVPITMTDPAVTLESELTAEEPVLEWRNTLGEYTLPSVESIATSKPRLPFVSLGLALAAAILLFATGRSGRRLPRRKMALAFLVAAYFLYPFARASADIPLVSQAGLGKDEAADVLQRLLTNVYRSFDIHSEEAIYDRLALTVTGDQLLDVYLESRQALELENRGGARVRIEEVVVQEVHSVKRTSESGFEVDVVWTVGGSVSHFGHQHFRQNWYDAVIRLVPEGGVWKIESVDVAEEKRLL